MSYTVKWILVALVISAINLFVVNPIMTALGIDNFWARVAAYFVVDIIFWALAYLGVLHREYYY